MKVKLRLEFNRPLFINDKLKWEDGDIVSCYIDHDDIPDFIRGKKPIVFQADEGISIGLKIDRFSWCSILYRTGAIKGSIGILKLHFFMKRVFGINILDSL